MFSSTKRKRNRFKECGRGRCRGALLKEMVEAVTEAGTVTNTVGEMTKTVPNTVRDAVTVTEAMTGWVEGRGGGGDRCSDASSDR